MKIECTSCTHFKNSQCSKNSKNNYNNCKQFRSIETNFDEIEQHKRTEYKNGNIQAAKEIQKKLDFFYWGLK